MDYRFSNENDEMHFILAIFRVFNVQNMRANFVNLFEIIFSYLWMSLDHLRTKLSSHSQIFYGISYHILFCEMVQMLHIFGMYDDMQPEALMWSFISYL